MMEDPPHRKTIQHFNEANQVRLLTFSCYERRPLLDNGDHRYTLSRCITRATDRHRWMLIAFVYMPEHVHLLVYPKSEEPRVEKLLYAIKKPFADRIKLRLAEQQSPLLQQLTVTERPGKRTFRFWLEGPGHDKNVISLDTCNKMADYLHSNPVRRGLC